MFAKLFGPDDDQVLVIKSTDEARRPVLNINFEAPVTAAGHVGLVCISEIHPNEAAAQGALDEMTEELARLIVEPWLKLLDEQLAIEKGRLQ